SAKSLRSAALTLTVLTTTHGLAFAGPVSRLSGEGDYATVYGYDPTGCLLFGVYVSRTSTKGASQTWLDYYAYDVCAQVLVGSGWGYIPDTAFKVSSKDAAVLKLTVAT